MKIIGVDPGYRRVAYCIKSESGFRTKLLGLDGMSHADRLASVYDCTVRMPKSDAAVIESPAFSKFGISDSIQKLITVQGVIEVAFIRSGTPVFLIGSSQWKSLTVGRALKGIKKNTKGGHREYLDVIERTQKVRFQSTDEADAYCIAKAVLLVAVGDVQNEPIQRALKSVGIDAVDLFNRGKE